MFELSLLEKILFVIVGGAFGGLAALNFYKIYQAIMRAKPDSDQRFDHLTSRIGAAIWNGLTQTRVFRDRFWVSMLHSGIFFGFTYYLLVNIVDGLEGFFGFEVKSDTWYTAIYNITADLLTFAILIGVIGLAYRRFKTKSGARAFGFNPRTLLHEAIQGGKIPNDSLIVSSFITLHAISRPNL
jgi:hypothetical protein